MRNLIWIILICLLLVAQAGILDPLNIEPANIALLLVVAAVLFAGLSEVLFMAIAGGVITDIVSGSPDGLITFSLLCTALTLYLIFSQVLSRHANQAVLIGSTAFAHILFLLWFLIFNGIFGIFGASLPISNLHFFTHYGLLGLVWNMLLAYPIFQLYLLIEELIPRHNVQPIRD